MATELNKTEEVRYEEIRKDLKTKSQYHFIDQEKGLDQLCREVFKNKDVEIFYPVGYDGGQKYQKIRKISFHDFGGKYPSGVSRSVNRGYGFTKVMRPFVDFIEEQFDIAEIQMVKTGKTALPQGKTVLRITEEDFEKLYLRLKHQLEKQKAERLATTQEEMHGILPGDIDKPQDKYVKDSAYHALKTWEQSIEEFSGNDKSAIKDLFDKLSLTKDFFTPDALLKTKQAIDEQYIDDVIQEYERLMKQGTETETLEKKWQSLLKKHSWIFSYIFSFPVILMEDEAYVGGKNLSNKNGKVTDFLVKNDLSGNVAFIEIKTHKTELVRKGKAYRGNDVFPLSSELSGATAQVLSQRDLFQKSFALHKMNSPGQDFESFNSKCVVLAGSIKDLTKGQLKSFELMRSNSKDVEILTFDELLERFVKLKSLMAGDV